MLPTIELSEPVAYLNNKALGLLALFALLAKFLFYDFQLCQSGSQVSRGDFLHAPLHLQEVGIFAPKESFLVRSSSKSMEKDFFARLIGS